MPRRMMLEADVGYLHGDIRRGLVKVG